MTLKINHIALAVEDIEQSAYFWHELLGLPISERRIVESEGVEIAFLQIGDAKIELVQPVVENGVKRFLQKRGAGIHHLCIEVAEIDAVLEQLRAADVTLINDQPKQHADGTRFAFIHPKSSGGVLLELYQLPVE